MNTLCSACLAPLETTTCAGVTASPVRREASAATALRRSGMPAAGVYFVLPARIAASAAAQMCAGVGKSGSPTERSITSTPEAARAEALAAMASVADGSSDAMRRARCRLFCVAMPVITITPTCVDPADSAPESYHAPVHFLRTVPPMRRRDDICRGASRGQPDRLCDGPISVMWQSWIRHRIDGIGQRRDDRIAKMGGKNPKNFPKFS